MAKHPRCTLPTTTQIRLQEALDALVASARLQGALLVTRDGFCILNRLPALPAAETLSAMGATLVGAAEAALAELNASGHVSVLVDDGRLRLLAEGAGREHLLFVVADKSQPLERLLEETRATATLVARALGG